MKKLWNKFMCWMDYHDLETFYKGKNYAVYHCRNCEHAEGLEWGKLLPMDFPLHQKGKKGTKKNT